MKILHVGGLRNSKCAGPNINVPQNVLYGAKYSISGCYNSNEINIEKLKNYKYFYTKSQMKNYDVKTLPNPFDNPDIVVFNSMYIFSHVLIAKKLKRENIPYIIIPRGAITNKAQQKKRLKKFFANILIFNKYIKNAAAIQFLTENEYEESKSFKFKKFLIRGNGTIKRIKTKQYLQKKEVFNIVFIGRIEKFHKGLDILMEAINEGKLEFRKYKINFKLYGPDDSNSVKYLNKKIQNYQIQDIITLNGPIYDEMKEKILLNADLFIHTSRLEGHPTSIIEAISYGVPVLVTPGTNISEEVEKYKLGFVSELSATGIKNKILEAYNLQKDFSIITKNEISYANNVFDWEKVMKSNIEEYKKIVEEQKRCI